MWSRNHQDKFRSSRLEGLSGPGTTRTSSDLAGPLLVGSSCWFIFFDGITAKAGQHKSDTKKAPTEVQPGTSNANKRVPGPVAFSGFCLAMTWLLIMCMMMLVAADVGDGHAEVGDGVVGGSGLCGPGTTNASSDPGTTRTSSELAGLKACVVQKPSGQAQI